MTNAFKCDCCDGFYEGTPKRYKLNRYHGGLTVWSRDEAIERMELCDVCAETVETMVHELLETETEEQ